MNVVCQYATSLSLLLSLIFILNRNTGQRCTKCPCWEHILCHLVPREESNAAEVWGARRPATLSAHPQAQARKMCWHKKNSVAEHHKTQRPLEYHWNIKVYESGVGSTWIHWYQRQIPSYSARIYAKLRRWAKNLERQRAQEASWDIQVFDSVWHAQDCANIFSISWQNFGLCMCLNNAWTYCKILIYIYWWYCKMFQPQVSLFNIAAFIHSLSFSLAKRSKQPTRGS